MELGKVCQLASTNGRCFLPEAHGIASAHFSAAAFCALDDLLGHQTAFAGIEITAHRLPSTTTSLSLQLLFACKKPYVYSRVSFFCGCSALVYRIQSHLQISHRQPCLAVIFFNTLHSAKTESSFIPPHFLGPSERFTG